MIYIRIFLLALIVVFIVDVSGVVASVKHTLSRWLMAPVKRLKPFDCSLCMVFWSGVVYLLAVREMCMSTVAYLCILSLLASELAEALRLLRDIIGLGLTKVFNFCNDAK